jgi:mitochondrial fission protein ELM1
MDGQMSDNSGIPPGLGQLLRTGTGATELLPASSCPSACWAITDSAAGNQSQARGLAQAVGLPFELKVISLRLPWRKLWPGIIPVSKAIFATGEQLQLQHPPRLVISCGKQAVMASLFLKQCLGSDVVTAHIQDPKIRSTRFDLVVAPEHDGLHGPNVLHTLGAPHHVTAPALQAAANSPAGQVLKQRNRPFAAVLIGGPNKCYRFETETLRPLIQRLRECALAQEMQFVILPSRRTPPEILQLFQTALGAEHFVWDRTGENPYLPALALASHVIVTGDSVSMTSEAAATCKPLYVFHLPEKRHSRRFRRFHEQFAERGMTRPFVGQLDEWTYPSPDQTHQIADVIRTRLGGTDVISSRSAA